MVSAIYKKAIPYKTRGVCCLLLSALLLSACRNEAPTLQTVFRVAESQAVLEMAADQESALPEAARLVKETLTRLDSFLDSADPESEIATANQLAFSTTIPIKKDTYRILSLSKKFNKLTGGHFDVTMAPIYYAWGYNGGITPEEMLEPEVAKATLVSAGMNMLRLTENSLRYEARFIRVDLKDIMDGYRTDLGMIRLRNNTQKNCRFKIGRSVRVLGYASEGKNWQEPIGNPWHTEQLLGMVRMSKDTALSSTYLYDRTRTIGDTTIGHIIDPTTGLPVTDTLLTAAIGPTATGCQALSTALMSAGVDGAPKILANFPRNDVLIIPNREPLEIWATEGFMKLFKPVSAHRNSVQTLVPAKAEKDPKPKTL